MGGIYSYFYSYFYGSKETISNKAETNTNNKSCSLNCRANNSRPKLK